MGPRPRGPTSRPIRILIVAAAMLLWSSAGNADMMSDDNIKKFLAIERVGGCVLSKTDEYLRNRDNTRVLSGNEEKDRIGIMDLEQDMASSLMQTCFTQLQTPVFLSLFKSPQEAAAFTDGAAFAFRSAMLQKIIAEDRRIGGKRATGAKP